VTFQGYWSRLYIGLTCLSSDFGRKLVKLAALLRNLSLSARFALMAALILGCSMVVLGSWVSGRIEDGVLRNTAATAALYISSFVEPHLQVLANHDDLPASSTAALDNLVRQADPVAALKIWGRGGKVIHSSQPENIGKTYPITPKLARAWEGEIEAEFNNLTDEENEVERKKAVPLMEIYVPVREAGTGQIIGVAEIYAIAHHLRHDLQSARLQSWLIVALLTCFLYFSLFGIVQRGSHTIREQQQALEWRVRELTQLLAENTDLHTRLAEANRRVEIGMERFLRRIGAELHDGPAQLIGLALLRLDSVQTAANDVPRKTSHQSTIEVIRGALSDALREIRNLSAGLMLPELGSATLSQTLELATRNYERRTGAAVVREIAGDLPRLAPGSLKACLYRFVQEALSNGFRHAQGIGQKLRASMKDDVLAVEVCDLGAGFNAAGESDGKNGLGLAWLSDRIETLGGTLEISSCPGCGTRLTARFKMREANV